MLAPALALAYAYAYSRLCSTAGRRAPAADCIFDCAVSMLAAAAAAAADYFLGPPPIRYAPSYTIPPMYHLPDPAPSSRCL